MARTPLLNLRVDDDRRAVWESAARDAGYTLAEYVREAVDERVAADAGSGRGKRPAKGKTREKPAETVRTGMCEHRVPAAAYCGRCDSP